MIKLRETILQLDEMTYIDIESELIKNKADNFLYVIQCYRNGTDNDKDILNSLKISNNAYYVLKSRLFSKIKVHLTKTNKTLETSEAHAFNDLQFTSNVYLQIQNINHICYNKPREIALAYLEKLEKDLSAKYMHTELLEVYSALKKLYSKSNKFFLYSKLYNKNIAFLISLEQSETILSNFNFILCQYIFSRSDNFKDKLHFLYKDILNHYQLCQSTQIEAIKQLIEIELSLFVDLDLTNFSNEDLLAQIEHFDKLVNGLPESTTQHQWKSIVNFLYEVYYIDQNPQKAEFYIEKTNQLEEKLLLYSDIAPVAMHLLYISEMNYSLEDHFNSGFISDENSQFNAIISELSKSINHYRDNNAKKAISLLNQLLNNNSFKEFIHINFEVKLLLCMFYLSIKEFDLAESIIKSVYRKIKSENLPNYDNVLALLKLFNAKIEGREKEEQNDLLILFQAKNKCKHHVLKHAYSDLTNLITI